MQDGPYGSCRACFISIYCTSTTRFLQQTPTDCDSSPSPSSDERQDGKLLELAPSTFPYETETLTQQITSGSSGATSTYTEIEESSEAALAPKKRSYTRKNIPVSANDKPHSATLGEIESVEPTAAKKRRYARKAKPMLVDTGPAESDIGHGNVDTGPAESDIGHGNLPKLGDQSTTTVEIEDWRVLPTNDLLDFFCDNSVTKDDIEGLLELYYSTLDLELKDLIEVIIDNHGEWIFKSFLDFKQDQLNFI